MLLRKILEFHQGTISFLPSGKEWEHIGPRTAAGLKRTTKTRLDANRSPGQSYEGFACQLLDAWESLHRKKTVGKTYFTNRLALPGETRVLAVWAANQLNYSQLSPPVTGALGVIGLSGRASHGGDIVMT